MTDDEWNLLQRFARGGDQDAFATLAERYVDFVYGSCLRQLRDAHLAEDVTQGVFLVLATKGRSLPRETILSGWLFQVARYACRNAIKMRARRTRHEHAAARPDSTGADKSEERAMDELKLLLDDAVSRLRQADRDAVLLRYFEGRSVKEVGAAMGVSEDAAGKRLSRVIAKLRGILARRGVAIPAGSAASAIAEASRADTPSGVRSAAGASAKNSTANPAAVTIARATMHTMKWAFTKSAVASVAAAMIVIGCGGVLAHQAMSGRSAPAAPPVASAALPVNPAESPAAESAYSSNEVTIVCHWEVVVSPRLARAIQSLGKPLATDSLGYQAYACDGESLVSALRGGKSDETLLAEGSTFEFPSGVQYRGWFADTGSQLGVDADTPGASLRPLFCRSTGKVRSDVSGSLVHLNLRVDDAEVTRTAGGHPVLAGTMHFKGNISAGSAVVFLGQFPAGEGSDAYDVQVWQSFVCPNVAWLYLESPGLANAAPDRRTVANWVDLGPKATIARALADAEWNWHAPAADANRDPRWTRTLADGTTVKLLAVSDPWAFPTRWWSPTGERVESPVPWGEYKPSAFPLPATERTVALLISGPGAAQITGASGFDDTAIQTEDASAPMMIQGKPVAMFPEPPAKPQPSPPAPKVLRFSTPVTPHRPIQVALYLAAGPWKDTAALRSSRPVHVGGIEYQLGDVDPVRPKSGDDPGVTAVSMRFADSPDLQTTVSAVRKDGTEVFFAPLPRQITQFAQTQPSMSDYYQSGPIGTGDIDHIEVKTRPAQRIAFTGISPDPTVPVPTNVVFPPTPRPIPASASFKSAPAPGTPGAAMADFQAAARAGDAKRLRADCYALDGSAARFADAHIRLAIASAKLLRVAEARFGARDADQTLAEDWSIKFWAEIGALNWQSTGQTATCPDTFADYDSPALRRVRGQWLVDCTDRRGNVTVTYNLADIEAKTRQLDHLTAATTAGKYQTVYDLRDDLVQDSGGNVTLKGS